MMSFIRRHENAIGVGVVAVNLMAGLPIAAALVAVVVILTWNN